jgi:carbon-monoxide dehydrogenase medium subunit
MKPPPFEYHDPATLAEARSLKEEHGSDAAILAGGQSLVPLMVRRLARPGLLIDVNRIRELSEGASENGTLVLGATYRQFLLLEDRLAGERIPLLTYAASFIGNHQTRHRGTVGGSIAFADPAAELPCLAVALDAELVALGRRGERTIAARDFFQGSMKTALTEDEILVAVRFPVPPGGSGWGFYEVARRHGDTALAGATALVRLGADGSVEHASVALSGIADRPVRVPAVESELMGSRASGEDIAAAALRSEDSVEDPATVDFPNVYRGDVPWSYVKKLASVVARRAITAAVRRARGEA